MRLNDMGASILITLLVLGAAYYAKDKFPTKYKAGVDKVQKFEKDYVDPYRTPEDNIDKDPVFNPEH